jgi:hypothetical protein
MASEILINLAVEDELSEHLLRVSLAQTGRPFLVGTVRGRQGNGYLKKMVPAFENAAHGSAYLVMADLDNRSCVPELIEDWFHRDLATYANHRQPNLIFRIAVRESESWVMADREAFAEFLGIALHHVPAQPDTVLDPKRQLLDLARKSRNRDLRDDLVPRPGDFRTIGPDYNGRLGEFLNTAWRASRAESSSPSFRRAFAIMKQFQPVFRNPSK